MGLLTTVRSAAALAFDIIGDLKQSVTYHHQTTTTYNATTGAVTRGESTQTIQAVVHEFSHREVDGQAIRPTDRRLLILAADLSGAPTRQDRVLLDSQSWE